MGKKLLFKYQKCFIALETLLNCGNLSVFIVSFRFRTIGQLSWIVFREFPRIPFIMQLP